MYWIFNIITAQVTPILLASSLQTYGTFYLFAGVHLAAILFALFTLPETKVRANLSVWHDKCSRTLLSHALLVHATYPLFCSCTCTGRDFGEDRTTFLQTLAGENKLVLLSEVTFAPFRELETDFICVYVNLHSSEGLKLTCDYVCVHTDVDACVSAASKREQSLVLEVREE